MAGRRLLVSMVALIIDKGPTNKIPVDVPEYEVSILQDIHGGDSVFEVGREDVWVDNFDLQATFDGLVSKYQSNTEADSARARYFSSAAQLGRFLDRMQPSRAAPAPTAGTPKPASGGGKGKGKGKAQEGQEAPQGQPAGGEPTLTPEQVAELLGKPAEEIVPVLATLDDADLVALEQAETEGAGREDLLAALDDEAESRKQ